MSRRHTAGRSWSGTPPQASSLSAAKSTTGLLSTRWKRSWRPLTPGWSLTAPSGCGCGCAATPAGCCVPRRASLLTVAPAPLVPAQGNGAVLPSRPVTRRLPGSLRGLVLGGAPAAEPADVDRARRVSGRRLDARVAAHVGAVSTDATCKCVPGSADASTEVSGAAMMLTTPATAPRRRDPTGRRVSTCRGDHVRSSSLCGRRQTARRREAAPRWR